MDLPPAVRGAGAIDLRRAARAAVLLVWAGFFAYLWVSGDVSRYLGPRTYWVVPFGALALGAAAAAHLATLRRGGERTGLSVGEVLGYLLILGPVIVVAIVPRAELGALAAARKDTSAVGVTGAILSALPAPEGKPSFIDLHYADQSSRYAATAGVGEGLEVELVGFVTTSADAPEGTFELTRFYVSCCAADAIPYSVAVDGGATGYPEDTWLRVAGTIENRGERFVLVADEIDERPEPKDPYLY